MSYEHLAVERHGPVGWLINDRPDLRNAMNSAMRDEFADAWTELNEDPAVRVIVHTGNGRDFQTGVDVTEIAGDGVGFERYRESMEDFDVHFTSWHQDVWKPVITAVNGICCGGGFHWVADADIVIYDPSVQHTLGVGAHHMNLDHSVWEGVEVTGQVRSVLSRGSFVIDDRSFVGRAGHGRFVPRHVSDLLA